jgi:hypothetical protein
MKHVTCPLCNNEFTTVRSRPTCKHCRTRFDSVIHGIPSVTPTFSDYLVGIVLLVAMLIVSLGVCMHEQTNVLFLLLFGGIGSIAGLAIIGSTVEYTCKNVAYAYIRRRER